MSPFVQLTTHRVGAIACVREERSKFLSMSLTNVANLLDVAIDFGYVEESFMGPPEDGYPVRVVMSWEQAKGLIELLQENVKLFEEHVGKIRDFEGEGDDDDDPADASTD